MSSPEPPRRRGTLPSVVSEPNLATAPHTPIPSVDTWPTEPPPAAMPMPPPRGLEAPRGKLPTLRDLAVEMARQEAPVSSPRAAPPSERPPSPNQWKGQLFKFVAALTALTAALTVALEAYTASLRLRIDNVAAKVTAQEEVTKPLPAQAAVAATDADKCRDWARAYDDYNRQIWARFGVSIPKQPNALPSTTVEFTAPKTKSRVTGGVILEVKTQPPPLP